MRYKVQFTDAETIVLNNSCYRKDTRENLMSVYSYLVKYCNERGSFNISFEELHSMYIRHHKKISLTALKRRITRLKEIGLVFVEKIYKLGYYINSYKVNRTPVTSNRPTNRTEEWTEEWTAQEPVEAVENTSVEVCEEKPKYQTLNTKKTIDIDYNNNNVKKESEKVKDIKVVIKAAKKLFKDLKVRSKFVRNRVLAKLNKYGLEISVLGLDNYIEKVIEESRQISKANYEISQANINKIKNEKRAKTLRFNNYEQRQYDWNSLERKLLGWEEDNKTAGDYEIKKDKQQDNHIQNQTCNLKFNNFEQRQYDWNSLERKLLGWDKD